MNLRQYASSDFADDIPIKPQFTLTQFKEKRNIPDSLNGFGEWPELNIYLERSDLVTEPRPVRPPIHIMLVVRIEFVLPAFNLCDGRPYVPLLSKKIREKLDH